MTLAANSMTLISAILELKVKYHGPGSVVIECDIIPLPKPYNVFGRWQNKAPEVATHRHAVGTTLAETGRP